MNTLEFGISFRGFVLLGFKLLVRPKIEKSVVLTHQLVYDTASPNKEAKQIVKWINSDFIFATHYFNILRSLSVQENQVPVIVDTHDIQSLNFAGQGYGSYLSNRIPLISDEIKKEIGLLDKANALVFISEAEKITYTSLSEKPAESLYFLPKININRLPLESTTFSSSSKKYILIVMSNNRGNQINLDWFLEEILPSLQELDFQIVGSISDYAEIKNYKFNNVEFLGVVENLTPVYDQAWGVAVPVIHGAGVAIKALEAIAYEKAIVSTQIGFRGISFVGSEKLVRLNEKDFITQLRDLWYSKEKKMKLEKTTQQINKKWTEKGDFDSFKSLIERQLRK